MNYELWHTGTHNFTDKKEKKNNKKRAELTVALWNDQQREIVEKTTLLLQSGAEVKTHTDFVMNFMHFTCFLDQNPFSFISLKLCS